MSSEYISVYAPVHLDPADSYGLIACELARYLNRQNVNTNLISLGNHIHPNQDEEIRGLANKPIVPARGGIFLGYPTAYSSYGELAFSGPKIALTMFESSLIPREWVPILNKMDAIITPSHFCAQAFERSGVTTEVFVFPLGICDVYKFSERTLDAPFTFLSFLDRGRRKGGLKSLQAFAEEFRDDPRVHLIFKNREVPEGRVKIVSGDPNIEYIYGDYSQKELADLYSRCHCLINPNKGEGFGLIPREFAATGGISLTTDWGGTSELNALWGWPIEYTLENADWRGVRNLEGQNLGEWAEADLFQLRSLLRDVYNRRQYYLNKAREKAKFAKYKYDWAFFAKSVSTLWEAVSNGYRGRSSENSSKTRILA